ncbi:MAG: peptidase MA family metallohydrolase, partial [Planctomycetota bacterium]
ERADYEAAIPDALSGSNGAFVSSDKLLAAFKEGRTEEDVFKTLYHEGFHQWLFTRVGARVPLWINEGFAEYFSEAAWDGRRFATGQVPRERLMILQEARERDELIALDKLFQMQDKGWLANVRSGEASLQYTQAWSIVHFLCHARGGRYRKRLLRYLRRLADGKEEDRAFRKSFGDDMERMEEAWQKYMAGLEPDEQEVCKGNMETVMFLAGEVYDDVREFDDLKELYDKLTDDRLKWEMESSYGETISSSDTKKVRGLFTCPGDDNPDGSSYILLRNPDTGLPELFCMHHRGNVIRVRYEREGDDLTVRSQRVVRATLPEGLQKALKKHAR